MRWKVNNYTTDVLQGAAVTIFSKQYATSLFSYHPAFSSSISLKSMQCKPYNRIDTASATRTLIWLFVIAYQPF